MKKVILLSLVFFGSMRGMAQQPEARSMIEKTEQPEDATDCAYCCSIAEWWHYCKLCVCDSWRVASQNVTQSCRLNLTNDTECVNDCLE